MTITVKSVTPEPSKLVKLLVPTLEKIIKNASWRKHQGLVQDCKNVIEWFSNHPNPAKDAGSLGKGKRSGDQGGETSGEPGHSNAARSPRALVNGEAAAQDKSSALHFPPPTALFDDGNLPVSTSVAEFILQPLHAACETLAAKAVEPALDCFQKLVANGHLRGELDSASSPTSQPQQPASGDGAPSGDKAAAEEKIQAVAKSPKGPPPSKILLPVLESVCRCYDIADETVELLVLKTLLSMVTSPFLRLHGECLLKAVRTCYNIFLGSRVPVNQTTAKASLTQMLVIVLRRMEADSSSVPVQPIVVADLMEPADRAASDNNVLVFVQAFITRVIQDIEGVVQLLQPPAPVSAAAGSRPAGGEAGHSSAAAVAVGPVPVAPGDLLVLDVPGEEEVPQVNLVEEEDGAGGVEKLWDVQQFTEGHLLEQQRAKQAALLPPSLPVKPPPAPAAALLLASAAADVASSSSGETVVSGGRPASSSSPSEKGTKQGELTTVEVRKAGQQPKVPGLADASGQLPDAVDPDKDGDYLDVQISNKLRRDAFLVFRALCKLSMKNPPQEGMGLDPFAVRGKVLALELLKICLENSGVAFRTSERFAGAIKQYLCLSLLKNCTSSLMPIFNLSSSIFFSLISRFRSVLKAEIGVFFPMIVLRVLENVTHPNFQQKTIVLRLLERLTVDPQILVDVFVNYDCDVDSSVNIFERMVNGLLKSAQGIPPGSDSTLNAAQDAQLRLSALKCLVGVLRSMGNWTNRQLRLGGAAAAGAGAAGSAAEEAEEHIAPLVTLGSGEVSSLLASTAAAVGSLTLSISEEGGEGNGGLAPPPLTPIGRDGPVAAAGASEAAILEQRRAYKLELQEGITLFNKKPSKGVDFLIRTNKVGPSDEEIVAFLKSTPGLNKSIIGDFLGEREERSLRIMHAYMDSFNLQGKDFDEAIRSVLSGFRLPGEAQKIDRIMEKFAERYCRCNPKAFTSADTAYVLAYSVIMLNTDAHNPMVKSKMSKGEFIKNNRGIDDGNDLPEEFLSGLYDRITLKEIKMKPDPLEDSTGAAAAAAAAQKGAAAAMVNPMAGLETILNLVIGYRGRGATQLETSDEVVRHMQEQFKSKAGKSGSVYYAATDVQIMRPMVDIVWAPTLAAFSVPLENSDDDVVVSQCLEGFRHAVHVTAVMCMRTQRDAFLTSLAKFTSLHSAADIKQRNIDAIKAVIAIADEDGNYLQDAWEHVLTCVSRFEHLHLIGEGAPPDAAFFAVQQQQSLHMAGGGGTGAGDGADGKPPQPRQQAQQQAKQQPLPLLRKKLPGGGKLPQVEKLARRGSYDSTGVGSAAPIGVVTPDQMSNLVSNLHLLDQVGSFEMSKIFTRSERLHGDAIVDFVRALAKVAMDELRSQEDPRVFSLTKIVEIAHFNMGRIRLVWSRIWAVLGDFFVTVGCMPNLPVAMYAIDSLRQLAVKFLERAELSNFQFQNEFLKPFVVVMRRSRSVEIRELVIRCVSQMVFTRVDKIKSGWKIMFMVFTTAATDDHKNIVLLAFETIEKIVREYFPYITETETTTFTDCVNCLIAFTNSRFNNDVSLNAIAFLRFCALKLAEGELGAAALAKEKGGGAVEDGDSTKSKGLPLLQPGQPDGEGFTDTDDHLYFWFPLLAGLSELTFDPRPDIRKSALEVLFDTLRFHGHMFSSGLWERVFESVLFPIFDYVRKASQPGIIRSAAGADFGDRDWDGNDASAPSSLPQEEHTHHRMHYQLPSPSQSPSTSDTTTTELSFKRTPSSVSSSLGGGGGELEMDAWLYETCTLALQLVVDLFVKFYPKVHNLLGGILSLLTSFITRPHQSLAAIGVAAFVRLMANGGGLFSEEKWDEVLASLKDASQTTLPDLAAVVRAAELEEEEAEERERVAQRRQLRRYHEDDDDEEDAAAAKRKQEEEPAVSLETAVSDVRCRIAVQLLLVQAMTEIYSTHCASLSNPHTLTLLDTLHRLASHAHTINADRFLRFRLQELATATQMPDPPLLRLESEAFHAYLGMLQRLPSEKPSLAHQVDVELRLVMLCEEVLQVYVGTAAGRLSPLNDELPLEQQHQQDTLSSSSSFVPTPLGSARRRELIARAPLVVATIGAVSGLKEDSFRRHLSRFFPLLAELIMCEHGSTEVQVALSRMFSQRIGPLLAAKQLQQLLQGG